MEIWYKQEFALIPATNGAQHIVTAWGQNGDTWSVTCCIGTFAVKIVNGIASESDAKIVASKWIAVMAAKIEQGGGGIVIIDDSDF